MSCSACDAPCPAPGITLDETGTQALIQVAKGMDWVYDGYLLYDNGDPIDISTWDFFGTFTQDGQLPVTLNMTTAIINGPGGHYRVTIPGTVTSPLSTSPNPGDWINNYRFKIWFTNTDFPNGFLMFRGNLQLVE